LSVAAHPGKSSPNSPAPVSNPVIT
jgi:hypothetical protein